MCILWKLWMQCYFWVCKGPPFCFIVGVVVQPKCRLFIFFTSDSWDAEGGGGVRSDPTSVLGSWLHRFQPLLECWRGSGCAPLLLSFSFRNTPVCTWVHSHHIYHARKHSCVSSLFQLYYPWWRFHLCFISVWRVLECHHCQFSADHLMFSPSILSSVSHWLPIILCLATDCLVFPPPLITASESLIKY